MVEVFGCLSELILGVLVFAGIHTKYACSTKRDKNLIKVVRLSVSGTSSCSFLDYSTLRIACLIPMTPISKFASWNKSPDVKPGEPEYYSKQYYEDGTRCWNGPSRSVIVSFPSLPLHTRVSCHPPFTYPLPFDLYLFISHSLSYHAVQKMRSTALLNSRSASTSSRELVLCCVCLWVPKSLALLCLSQPRRTKRGKSCKSIV